MPIRKRLQEERIRAAAAIRKLDRQTTFVLLSSVFLIFVQFFAGSRRRFLEVAGDRLPDGLEGLFAWSWWFGIQGISGFLIPVLILLLLFRRSPREIGLGIGDWRFGLGVSLLYVPFVVLGTWYFSADPTFQQNYPHLQQAAHNWGMLAVYELMFLFYWIGWEYLWRGYVLFGTVQTFGVYAIIVQAIPFAILHATKPPAEAVLSVVGGVALGAVVWRCRSFWYAVPVHAVQMLLIDVFCTLRIRTGVTGYGIGAIAEILSRI
ncbi:MAG TPA: CPBP family intramembrane glutamic endopeptidase [Rhodothermales bacterium]